MLKSFTVHFRKKPQNSPLPCTLTTAEAAIVRMRWHKVVTPEDKPQGM